LTQFTRPATWDDLKTLAGYLAEAGVEYALVGGYAIAAHGFNRFSEDIDLLVEPSADNARRWIAALSRLPDAAAAELLDQPDVFAHDQRYAIRINDEFTVDVMPSIAGLTWAEMKPHVTTLEIGGTAVCVLDLPGLLKTKQGVRPKDQMDAAVIKAVLAKARPPLREP
jgi:Nucleotidyl transferase AbiEii toxin, Type IV TA system